MKYRIASTADLPRIAKIHALCFPGTFITSFGNKLIEKYYEEYIEEDNSFILAIADNDDIQGFCMGYRTGSKARDSFMQKNKIRLAFRMAWLCLTFNKLAISKCLAFIKPKKASNEVRKPQAKGDLLSICVTDACKGKGIAMELVSEFEKLLRDKGIADYTLSVYKTNKRAIHFYEKCGLTFYEDSNDEIKMYKKL